MAEEMKSKALGFIRENPIVYLATLDGDHPRLRVMAVAKVEDDFTVWFACGRSSAKIKQIEQCPNVALSAYAEEHDLVVEGRAEAVTDKEALRRMWDDEWKRYFPGGPEDPEYCLIKVTPASAHYRELKTTGFEAEDVL